MRVSCALLAVIGLMNGRCAIAQPLIRCTEEEANRAEAGIDRLNTWALVFDAFNRYGQCDDGAIAEGYDDKIVNLLVNHGGATPELSKIIQSNLAFKVFVMKHIDTLMTPDQSKTIIENARYRCLFGAIELCSSLEGKATRPGE